MSEKIDKFLLKLKNPMEEIRAVREGVTPYIVESYIKREELVLEDILEDLDITRSTYFKKKKAKQVLDSYTSEKIIRLISVIELATEVLGKEVALEWIYRKVPSLGSQIPIQMMDTDAGHRLVEQALLQIKYGVYG